MVLRTRPLPQGILRGRYRIAPDLIDRTRDALTSFYEEGRDEGGHEGICFWAGIEGPEQTYFRSVIVPHARHERFGVFVSGPWNLATPLTKLTAWAWGFWLKSTVTPDPILGIPTETTTWSCCHSKACCLL